MKSEDKPRPRAGRRRLAADQDGADLAQETRRNIIEVATREFVAHGFEGASVNEIAKASDTSKRMLYYHFESKQGLYAAVLEAAYARVGRNAEGADPGISAMESLRAYAQEAFDKFNANEDFVRLIMAENLANGSTIRGSDPVRRRSNANLAALDAICARGRAEGTMRPDFRVIDLYFAILGVSFHAVSNRVSTEVSLGLELGTEEELAFRRKLVGDLACRYAKTS
ncbi:TetR family transcriptional regulator [Donghicola mangrovi]|uniref:TetR/AcrR family transcriptional regulator n=1 Tax=Donghicola mangrovi TaxID=2729614 RepID=A0A850QDA2_9RHOB|nr:TetR/AcrR family transcriptional regulator [Donghicola mangrovi]